MPASAGRRIRPRRRAHYRETVDPLSDEWARPAPGRRALRADALVAVALAAGTGLSVILYSVGGVYDHPAPWWASVLYVLFTSLPLALRRVRPGVVAVVVSI